MAFLVFLDAAVIAAACYGAWILRTLVRVRMAGGWWPQSWENYFKEPLIFFVVPLAIFCMWACGLYRPRRDRSLWNEQVQLAKAVGIALMLLLVGLWVTDNQIMKAAEANATATIRGTTFEVQRLQLWSLAAFLFLGLAVHRLIFRQVLRAFRRRGRNLRHVAIVGTGRLGQIAFHTIGRNTWTGLNVAYFISHHDRTSRGTCCERPVEGGLDDLEDILERQRVDGVYLAVPTSHASSLPDILKRLDRFPVDVRIIPDVHPRFLPQGIGELDGMPVLSYRESPLYGVGGVSKRLVDIAGASLALLLFAPVMLVAALLVRLTSDGPILFRQRRVSLGGEEFVIFKFRTMVHHQDPAPRWTKRNDPRITPIGRWLRKTSIDELPQLINVLRGDMSLVGPRPERPELIERFREDWRGYMLRQHVKAGITGWAQINGLRGDTSLRKRLQYDLFYVRHWSILLDLRILMLTPFRGFVHRNAH
ncbi:MAG: undecaprenyl-phosphate glucose phosphotransferase [Phycisphaerales bacterium]|nr:undecaprenyl-phosphate glucose phosphotransferase [Phycisphaerales bacterium]